MLIAKARKLMDRLGYSNSHMRMLNLFVSALNWSQMLLLSGLVFVVLIHPEGIAVYKVDCCDSSSGVPFILSTLTITELLAWYFALQAYQIPLSCHLII